MFYFSEFDSNEAQLSKFYKNGKLVSNIESGLELSETVSSEKPTQISFLKSELVSDIDDDDESTTGGFEQTEKSIKTDEEIAYASQCDPKMGLIFRIFQTDYW